MFYMLNMSNITVRDVDEEVFREFKAETSKQGLKLGTALTLAMRRFKGELKTRRKLTDFKPTSWGEGTEHLSEQIDDILFGEK